MLDILIEIYNLRQTVLDQTNSPETEIHHYWTTHGDLSQQTMRLTKNSQARRPQNSFLLHSYLKFAALLELPVLNGNKNSVEKFQELFLYKGVLQ